MSRFYVPVIALSILIALAAASAPYVAPTPPQKAPASMPTAPTESPLRNRAEFARLLAKVEVGMSREQVRELLGRPDDRCVGDEVHAYAWRRGGRGVRESWSYGGDGHLTFPTLGNVGFDEAGKVMEIIGAGDTLPGISLPTEPETRRILRLMHRLRGYHDHNDPLRVIQVVNALQPLGKPGAVAVIDEFLRVVGGSGIHSKQAGLFVVARCLFNVPEPPGYFPRMFVGAPYPEAPSDPKRSPRFPVVLYRDIPIVGINGYALGGYPEPFEAHFKPYREWGTLRAQPLTPPDNPLEVVDGLLASTEWPEWGIRKALAPMVAREQLLRLVDPVFRVEEDQYDNRLNWERGGREWPSLVQAFGELGARWDRSRNTYTREFGLHLPPRAEPLTHPHIWNARTSEGNLEVTLYRRHRNWVQVTVSVRSKRPPMPILRAFVGATEIRTGLDKDIPTGKSGSATFAAPAGSDIRLVLERGGKALAETTVRP